MARNFKGKSFKPKRANGSLGLEFKQINRCDTCGTQYLKKSTPAQCLCGSIAFTHFDSKAEGKRWSTLSFYQEKGIISDLRRQVRIPLNTKGPDGLSVTIGHYIADFDYNDGKGVRVIEDVKGLITDLADWKIRHVKAQYGIDVKLTQ